MTPSAPVILEPQPSSRFLLRVWFDAFARRYPFTGLLVAILASNLAGSFFNFFYNTQLIVQRYLDEAQQRVFWDQAAPLYNLLAYPLAFGVAGIVIWPLYWCRQNLRLGRPIDAEALQFCRRRLVNVPIIQLVINPLGWLPGAIFFPWFVCTFGGMNNAVAIWQQFVISFVISTLFTTVQTFFIVQSYLTAYLYPVFFRDARPESVPGIRTIPFNVRLIMMWLAVALMPMVALLTVALNLTPDSTGRVQYVLFAVGLVVVSAISGGGIFWLVGRDLWRWMQIQTRATEQIAGGNFDIRIDQPRPDEWGRLTNHFNDMATALSQAWDSHETLGQLVSPQVRDQILSNNRGFEVHMQEITVLFVDIRGFTARCSHESPQRIGELLNRFLTLAIRAIEGNGGYVNKFLGDGVMALFGATHHHTGHADLALASACDLLSRLDELNTELIAKRESPLIVGIGIHTGAALVGCFGATVIGDDGQPLMRREFTAIGETVNLCQRIEQLTKKCHGPILLSEATRTQLRGNWMLEPVGTHDLPGSPTPMLVHRVVSE